MKNKKLTKKEQGEIMGGVVSASDQINSTQNLQKNNVNRCVGCVCYFDNKISVTNKNKATDCVCGCVME
ncbi:MAG: hypothetical protein LBV74_20775 [Tannerella sp.]|jgi:hypothetical protein|nr:hypothetical protein [Tannerella sp.]